jgi:hypothetical protein
MSRRFDHEMLEIVSMLVGLIKANSDYRFARRYLRDAIRSRIRIRSGWTSEKSEMRPLRPSVPRVSAQKKHDAWRIYDKLSGQ